MQGCIRTVLPFIAILFFYLFWWYSPFLSYFDSKLYDQLSTFYKPSSTPDATITVEIDDRSLDAIGQWPWRRIITADLIQKISDGSPNAIVLDTVFSEPDQSSPDQFILFYKKFFDMNITIQNMPENLQSNDRILSASLAQAPIVLPLFSNTHLESDICILPKTIVNADQSLLKSVVSLESLVCNIPNLQKSSYSIGHIHAKSDSDGILRRNAMLMQYKNDFISTLSLSALSLKYGDIHVNQNSTWLGGQKLDIGKYSIISDQSTTVLLHFYPVEKYKNISAIDILEGKVDPSVFKNKYILIGSTAFGLDSTYTLSDGSVRSGVYIHATTLENIINGDLNVQPHIYQRFNFMLAFLVGIVLLIQMLNQLYMRVMFIFFGVIFTLSLVSILALKNHIYLSVGYLIVPLVSFVFILSLTMFVIDYLDKKRFMDEILRSNAQKALLKSALDESEHEIEYQRAMLFQQSKLAAMGEMIDNIAHQWRQPLNLLGMIIQQVPFDYQKGRVDDQYAVKLSNDSMEQIMFMSQTIDDFRNFLRPDRKSFPFDIALAIEESLHLLSGMFKAKQISVDFDFSDESLIVLGSPSEFKQVVINLLHNARDALIENNVKKAKIEILLSNTETEVIVQFKDNGAGIDPDVIDRIFEANFTTKPDDKGTGIGLYIVDAIVRSKMNGTIEATNTEIGATFTIRLPLISKGI